MAALARSIATLALGALICAPAAAAEPGAPAPSAPAASSAAAGPGSPASSAAPTATATATVAPAAASAPAPAATSGSAAAPFDPAQPATWRLSAKLGPGSREREALLRDLTAKATSADEKPLTREEAEALLDDPRAQPIYAEKTISIVAPSMLTRQRKGHVDLLQKFLAPERIEAGARFVGEHRERLEAAEKRHGVDKEVIVSILMWESRLGTITGEFSAFNSFTSQAFFIDEANAVALSADEEQKLLDPKSQPARVERIRARARANLLVLVRTCKARGMDPLTVKGSWAGALGFPQFMPASLRWAEDGDGDGKIDLFTFEDSIASIGNYLKLHGFSQSRQKAVWGYNHEQGYVDGVLAFADALAARLDAPAQQKPAGAQKTKSTKAKPAPVAPAAAQPAAAAKP